MFFLKELEYASGGGLRPPLSFQFSVEIKFLSCIYLNEFVLILKSLIGL